MTVGWEKQQTKTIVFGFGRGVERKWSEGDVGGA